ncbi:MAG TPA: hypothetical protein PK916_06140 [Bacteroidota bacterium]|nr:hypothetical protein [Bacteroidota bacterium]
MRYGTFLITLVALVLIAAATPLRAQEQTEFYQQKERWGVGLQAGLMSGMGLAARFHPQGRFGFQLAGGAFKGSGDMVGDIGIEGQFDFDLDGRNRFYGFVGMGLYTNGKDGDDKLEGPFRAGFGLAYDWAFARTMVFSTSLGLTYFTDGVFLPLPQVGLYYIFD